MQGDIAVHPLPDTNVGWKNHGCGFSAMEKMLFMGHLLRKTTGGNAYPSELTGKTREGDMGCFSIRHKDHKVVYGRKYVHTFRGQFLHPSSR
jgi:hypothetical protein